MRRARWTAIARADFERIDKYYQGLSPEFADRLGIAALRAARFLAENPHAGPLIEEPVRKWRVRSFDYVLLYRLSVDGVEILRMHHAHENWRAGSAD
ncbi:type II toxin-antitoxin system RelE/ParE family toxin [Sphingomonas sp. DT-207]|uniref:type II toxin-antitoxin system RelE/ParE family toxin n=1 Tax=Sphingomonas sp. DT-207 TaxID=3396167 RepID=UPI003F1E1530